jgi:glycerophosphoryl diester phosphodiesterase
MMEIWAHRGASHLKTENTLEAFEEALKHNITGIELDVQLDRRGVPIVFHDKKLSGWPIRHLSVEELSSTMGYDVPTLDQVLTLLAGKTSLIIELKTSIFSLGKLERASFELVKQHGCINQTTFSSSTLASLFRMKRVYPGVNRAFIMERMLSLPQALLAGVPVHISAQMATNKNIMTLRDYGFKILVWTVNNSDYARHMKDLGVDGFFTDRPEDY